MRRRMRERHVPGDTTTISQRKVAPTHTHTQTQTKTWEWEAGGAPEEDRERGTFRTNLSILSKPHHDPPPLKKNKKMRKRKRNATHSHARLYGERKKERKREN